MHELKVALVFSNNLNDDFSETSYPERTNHISPCVSQALPSIRSAPSPLLDSITLARH